MLCIGQLPQSMICPGGGGGLWLDMVMKGEPGVEPDAQPSDSGGGFDDVT